MSHDFYFFSCGFGGEIWAEQVEIHHLWCLCIWKHAQVAFYPKNKGVGGGRVKKLYFTLIKWAFTLNHNFPDNFLNCKTAQWKTSIFNPQNKLFFFVQNQIITCFNKYIFHKTWQFLLYAKHNFLFIFWLLEWNIYSS